MLEFLHDAELIAQLLAKALSEPPKDEVCPLTRDLILRLDEIRERADKLADVRRMRGDTPLIFQERVYLVFLVLHARIDLGDLLAPLGSSKRGGTPENGIHDILDFMSFGAFLQLKALQQMSEDDRSALYQESVGTIGRRERVAALRNELPMFRPQNRLVNDEFIAKVDDKWASMPDPLKEDITSCLSKPKFVMGKGWYSIRNYWAAPMRQQQFIPLDSAEQYIEAFNKRYNAARITYERECGEPLPEQKESF